MTNGGFVQLPAPKMAGESMTWDEYKAQTGIDLNDIFEVTEQEGGKDIEYRKDFNKPIIICGYVEAIGDRYAGAPNCGYPNIYLKSAIGTIEYIEMSIGNAPDAYWGIQVHADRTIRLTEV